VSLEASEVDAVCTKSRTAKKVLHIAAFGRFRNFNKRSCVLSFCAGMESLQLYTPALDNAFNNLINAIKGLTDTLSRGSTNPYLTPPQTPGRVRHINASEVVVTSPYFTRNASGKRDRSPSPPPRKRKSRKAITASVRRGKKVLDAVELPVTSPYFPPTPESEKVLSTPARRCKRSKGLDVVTSAYFTGDAEVASELGPSKPKRRKRTITVVDAPVIPIIEPPECWWETETLPVKDAISLGHFKAQSVLYYQLWLARPVLIQGTQTVLLPPISLTSSTQKMFLMIHGNCSSP
jgi:hypothetical protein